MKDKKKRKSTLPSAVLGSFCPAKCRTGFGLTLQGVSLKHRGRKISRHDGLSSRVSTKEETRCEGSFISNGSFCAQKQLASVASVPLPPTSTQPRMTSFHDQCLVEALDDLL